MVDIASIIISSLSLLISLVIGYFTISNWHENSYPWIDISIKHHQKELYELSIINTGKTTAFDLLIFISTGWGETEPNRIDIRSIKPQQSLLRKIKLPLAKQGGVYTIKTTIRCKRKFLFFKKATVDEQEKTFANFDIKPLIKYKPQVKTSGSKKS